MPRCHSYANSSTYSLVHLGYSCVNLFTISGIIQDTSMLFSKRQEATIVLPGTGQAGLLPAGEVLQLQLLAVNTKGCHSS